MKSTTCLPLVVLLLVALGSTGHAIDVLVYDVNTTLGNAEQAAILAGYDVTLVSDSAVLIGELGTGNWDLVSLDIPSSGMDAGVSAAIVDYIADEGVVMMRFWNFDTTPDLQAAFEVVGAADYTTPIPIMSWDDVHPIYNTPNPITTPIPASSSSWADDGDRMTAGIGAIELGGFVATPTPGQAAIVLGNSGRTIMNGFVYDGYLPDDIIPFLQNQMEFLLGGSVTGPQFVRGDANADGAFDISDAVYQLAALFIFGTTPPTCDDATDSNDDGVFDITDPVVSLASLFIIGSPPPPDPVGSCGEDPTPDALDCPSFAACP